MTTPIELYIPLKRVAELTSLSKSTLHALQNKEGKYYDPSFPQKIIRSARCVRYRYADVVAWMEQKTLTNQTVE